MVGSSVVTSAMIAPHSLICGAVVGPLPARWSANSRNGCRGLLDDLDVEPQRLVEIDAIVIDGALRWTPRPARREPVAQASFERHDRRHGGFDRVDAVFVAQARTC